MVTQATFCLRIIVQADRIATTKGCQGDATSLLSEKRKMFDPPKIVMLTFEYADETDRISATLKRNSNGIDYRLQYGC
jgi:hypothetical protein